MTDYTHLEYVDGSNVSVCQTLADTFWSKTFFIGGTLIFFALPLAILIMLYSVIAINLMMHPAIIPLRRLVSKNKWMWKDNFCLLFHYIIIIIVVVLGKSIICTKI